MAESRTEPQRQRPLRSPLATAAQRATIHIRALGGENMPVARRLALGALRFRRWQVAPELRPARLIRTRKATLQSLEPAALGRLAITGSRPSNAAEGVETCEIRKHSNPKVVQG